jgi:hypothetical protein
VWDRYGGKKKNEREFAIVDDSTWPDSVERGSVLLNPQNL